MKKTKPVLLLVGLAVAFYFVVISNFGPRTESAEEVPLNPAVAAQLERAERMEAEDAAPRTNPTVSNLDFQIDASSSTGRYMNLSYKFDYFYRGNKRAIDLKAEMKDANGFVLDSRNIYNVPVQSGRNPISKQWKMIPSSLIERMDSLSIKER